MKELVLKEEAVKVKAFGKECILHAPSCDEYFDYLEKIEEKSKESTRELIGFIDEYLIERGMDAEALRKVTYKGKQQIVRMVNQEDDEDEKKS